MTGGDQLLPAGFTAAGTRCGLKKNGRPDLGLILADEPHRMHAVFTQNQLLGAHIPVCRRHLTRSGGRVRALLVNSGNANCATGTDGERDNEAVCRALAQELSCPVHEVLLVSTGVIGARLETAKIVRALPGLLEAARSDGIGEFAGAIMTTDTVPKVASGSLTGTDGEPVLVLGTAKGSGMIHPDMATMLAFVLTDGRSPADLGIGLRAIADQSFHRVTVDGDTSPNDTFMLWTSERHWCRPEKNELGMTDVYPLEEELTRVSQSLARMIARDGEGATRLITLRIQGAMSDRDALDVGRFIATSPLVKTAVTGRDPNWGRILSAASSSGLPIDLGHARVAIGGHDLFAAGEPHPENEPAARQHLLDSEEVIIDVNLATGPFSTEVWTCDLTTDYVQINADYRS